MIVKRLVCMLNAVSFSFVIEKSSINLQMSVEVIFFLI